MLRPFALFGTLTLGLHSVAWACSCLQESVEENIDEAELIVFGTVVEIATEPARPRLTQVGFDSSCGLDALEGEDWVFFSGDGTHAFLCSGSHRVDDAATDPGLAALDGYFAE